MHTLFNVPLLVQRANQRLTSSLATARDSAALTARRLLGLMVLLAVLELLLTLESLFISQLSYVGPALQLGIAIALLFAWRKHRKQQALAWLLSPLDKDQVDQLFAMSDRSDVVKESVRKASRARRDLLTMDLVYAQLLVVREVRNGEKPSDRMPLEQTKGMLGASF